IASLKRGAGRAIEHEYALGQQVFKQACSLFSFGHALEGRPPSPTLGLDESQRGAATARTSSQFPSGGFSSAAFFTSGLFSSLLPASNCRISVFRSRATAAIVA